MFFLFLVGYEFLKAWNWTLLFKNNLKISLIFGNKFGFRGPFMMEIIPHSNFQGLRLFQRAVYSGVYNRHLNERIMTFWLKNHNLITLEWVSQNKQTFFDSIDHMSQNKHVLQTLHNLEIPEKSIQSMITIGNKSDLVKEDDWKFIR